MLFDIIIVGSGIAGLAAAIALRNKGHEVTIIEATAQLKPIGGVIVLQANATRMLDHLGVYESLVSYCSGARNGPSTRSYEDGSPLASVPAELHEQEYGYPLWPLHRADLQKVLVETIHERGVKLRLGCRVLAVDEGHGRPAIITHSGERLEADIIVGADGIDSAIRKSIMPDIQCIRDSGMDVTRATIPAAVVRSDPATAGFMDHVALWCGPSATIAAMAVRGGEEQLLGLDCCHRRIEDQNNADGRKQDIAQLKEHYRAFSPAIQKILACVDEARVWKLRESTPSSWVSRGGRIVVIGDAAHASLPWVGQGGGMALEDGASLAEALEWSPEPRDIQKALRAFQEIRKPRCERVQQWSAIKGRRAFLDQGSERQERDENFRSVNAWVKAEPWNKVHIDDLPELGASNWKAWLCGHHAPSFTRRQLDIRFGQRKSSKMRANL